MPDLVFVAVPLHEMRSSIAAMTGSLDERTVIADVGSVKAPIAELMVELGLASRYVGTHPMAGTELAGFDASSDELLVGAPWAVTLAPTTPRHGVEALLTLITTDMGGRVFPLTATVHDSAVALISHLPHAVANELLNVVGASDVKDVALGLAAGSFRDGTRVAGTSPRRTEAMITENSRWVVPAVRQAAAGLSALADRLESGQDVSDFFDSASQVKRLAQARSSESGQLDLDALSPQEWVTALLRIGSRGGRIVSVDPSTGVLQYSV